MDVQIGWRRQGITGCKSSFTRRLFAIDQLCGLGDTLRRKCHAWWDFSGVAIAPPLNPQIGACETNRVFRVRLQQACEVAFAVDFVEENLEVFVPVDCSSNRRWESYTLVRTSLSVEGAQVNFCFFLAFEEFEEAVCEGVRDIKDRGRCV